MNKHGKKKKTVNKLCIANNIWILMFFSARLLLDSHERKRRFFWPNSCHGSALLGSTVSGKLRDRTEMDFPNVSAGTSRLRSVRFLCPAAKERL